MKITGAVIIVRLDDGKSRQVDISSDDVMLMLYLHQQKTRETINVIDPPIDGLVLGDISDMSKFGNCQPMPEWSDIVNPEKQ